MEKAQLQCYLHESQIRERNLLKEIEQLKKEISTPATVYAVECSSGEYDDFTKWILGNKIFLKKEDAVEICHRYNLQHDKDFLKTQFQGCTYEEFKAKVNEQEEKFLEYYKKTRKFSHDDSFFESDFYKQNAEIYDEIEFGHYNEAEVIELQLIK